METPDEQKRRAIEAAADPKRKALLRAFGMKVVPKATRSASADKQSGMTGNTPPREVVAAMKSHLRRRLVPRGLRSIGGKKVLKAQSKDAVSRIEALKRFGVARVGMWAGIYLAHIREMDRERQERMRAGYQDRDKFGRER